MFFNRYFGIVLPQLYTTFNVGLVVIYHIALSQPFKCYYTVVIKKLDIVGRIL